MYVKLLKPWKACQPGKVFSEMNPNEAELLIKRGIAKKIKPPKGAGATESAGATDSDDDKE